MPYIKADAMKLLIDKFGWQPYPQKHFESRFTKFVEGYWWPTRFGFDTRRVQYSALIVTKQMTRSDALEKLKTPVYDDQMLARDFEYVATKLGITMAELKSYHDAPKKSHRDYKNQEWLFNLGASVLKATGMEIGGKR
jgi:hypothetical protein